MNDETGSKDSGDAIADSIAVTAILTIIIVTVVYWLGGMPV